MDPDPKKRLPQVARRCLERLYQLEGKLFRTYFKVLTDRLHLVSGSPERGYYTAGYVQALKDVRALVDDGEFPLTIDVDDPKPVTDLPVQMCLGCGEAPATSGFTGATVPLCCSCAARAGSPRGVSYEHEDPPCPEA